MGEYQACEEAPEAPVPAVGLRLVAAAAWHVIRERRFSDFPRVLSFVERVAEAAPGLVSVKHLTKLRLGLKAKIIMHMLEEDQPHGRIYDAIDTYFPENETPLCNAKATAEDMEMVHVQKDFKILVLKLLNHRMEKELYMQKYLEINYGEAFVNALEGHFCKYLCQLERVLPEPQFQMVLEAASFQTPTQLPPPSPTILNQYFSAVRYQQPGGAEPPTSPPHSSNASRESGDDDFQTPPRSPQPGRSRDLDSPSCSSGGDSPGRWSETSEDLVPDSESERSTSPFHGEYQSTHLCTFIPTFREHLRDSSSQSNSSLL